MHTNYTLVTQPQLPLITSPLHSLQQFDLLTLKVFLAFAGNDRCPREWTGKIFLSVTETLSVYLIISLSIFKSACVAPTPHDTTLNKSLLQQTEDRFHVLSVPFCSQLRIHNAWNKHYICSLLLQSVVKKWLPLAKTWNSTEEKERFAFC